MSARRLVALLMAVTLTAPTLASAQSVPQPPPGAPPAPPPGLTQSDAAPAQVDPAVTPARLSYLSGAVSFRRPGADDWAPAAVNTPLAPGDTLYVGQAGALEIQVGSQGFIRAAQETELGLDNQEADFVQVSVPVGHVAIDVGRLPSGSTIEIDTPNGAFTLDQPGYYRIDVTGEWAALAVHRGGRASVTTASGGEIPIQAGQQAVVSGTDAPRVELRPNPPLDAWDQWNQTRTAQLQQSESARYVASGVYGIEALDRHGAWHVEASYGPVWVPAGVPAGWVPYSTGRWIWDPRFGWTWLDEAPWGWAPYHYGRWVFVRSRWAWAPGPVVVRPVYAPALVVFLGARTVGRPLCWAPLAWGEPVIPWWGRPGFVGVATWAGWGGPRVVNNVVVNRTTVNVTNITVYRHVRVTKAVVGVPPERFGRDHARPARISATEVQQLRPVRGAPRVQPVAASVAPTRERGIAPPATTHRREVVATRKPHDPSPSLRAAGLPATTTEAPARNTRVVAPPARRATPARVSPPAAGRVRDERSPDVIRQPGRQPDATREQRERPADANREPAGRQPDAIRDQRARPADANREQHGRQPGEGQQGPRPPAARSQEPAGRLQQQDSPDAGRPPRPTPRRAPSSEPPARSDRTTPPETPAVGPTRPALTPPAVAPRPAVPAPQPQNPATAPRVVDRPAAAPPAPPQSIERPPAGPPPVAPRAIERTVPPESPTVRRRQESSDPAPAPPAPRATQQQHPTGPRGAPPHAAQPRASEPPARASEPMPPHPVPPTQQPSVAEPPAAGGPQQAGQGPGGEKRPRPQTRGNSRPGPGAHQQGDEQAPPRR